MTDRERTSEALGLYTLYYNNNLFLVLSRFNRRLCHRRELLNADFYVRTSGGRRRRRKRRKVKLFPSV